MSQLNNNYNDNKSFDDKQLLYFPKNSFSPRFGEDFFTFEITSYQKEINTSCYKPIYINYLMTIRIGKKTIHIKKRFSEFIEFHKYLLDFHKLNDLLPVIPMKTCFNVLDDKVFLDNRKEKLYCFLDSILKLLSFHYSQVIINKNFTGSLPNYQKLKIYVSKNFQIILGLV